MDRVNVLNQARRRAREGLELVEAISKAEFDKLGKSMSEGEMVETLAIEFLEDAARCLQVSS